jgi:hypothetical protein
MKSPLGWPVSIPKFKLEISQTEACQQFDSNVGVERVLVNYRDRIQNSILICTTF